MSQSKSKPQVGPKASYSSNVGSQKHVGQQKSEKVKNVSAKMVMKEVARLKKNGVSPRMKEISRSFGPGAVHKLHQLYYPSSTALTLTGTGTTYTAGTGTIAYSTSDAYIALYFMLSDLPQETTLANLYDEYRLTRVVVHLYPAFNEVLQTSSPVYSDLVLCATDPDDAASLSTRGSILEYETCKVFPPLKPIHYPIKPRIALAAYGGAFTSYANSPSQWIDTASILTQHYGFKAMIGATNANGAYYRIIVESDWEFRTVR